jgi:hypothetical protein
MINNVGHLVKSELRRSSVAPTDSNGYVSLITENLVPGVRLDQFESDLKVGGGHELEKKFRALHSSSALAINTFAPFTDSLPSLSVAGKNGFITLVLEKQLPSGLRGTPPGILMSTCKLMMKWSRLSPNL